MAATGFDGYNKISTATDYSSSPPKVTTTIEYQPGKTLWDWLQLLIVPLVLAIGGFWLNQIQKSREEKATEQRTKFEREAAEKRAQTEREIAEDNQRETALQDYIDKMSDLLLRGFFVEANPEYERARKIARVRTLTVLPLLNGSRKRSVLQFLYEAGLINADKVVIDLRGANLREASLNEVNLSNIHLSQTDLSKASFVDANLTDTNLSAALLSDINLSGVQLVRANLSEAVLSGANLFGANLSHANLSRLHHISHIVSRKDGPPIVRRRSNLKEADLREADLRDANLQGIDLELANLSHADLRGANLELAFLKDANLSGAHITTDQLKAAGSTEGAIWPDGSKHP